MSVNTAILNTQNTDEDLAFFTQTDAYSITRDARLLYALAAMGKAKSIELQNATSLGRTTLIKMIHLFREPFPAGWNMVIEFDSEESTYEVKDWGLLNPEGIKKSIAKEHQNIQQRLNYRHIEVDPKQAEELRKKKEKAKAERQKIRDAERKKRLEEKKKVDAEIKKIKKAALEKARKKAEEETAKKVKKYKDEKKKSPKKSTVAKLEVVAAPDEFIEQAPNSLGGDVQDFVVERDPEFESHAEQRKREDSSFDFLVSTDK